jgi:hypothetical protein
MGAGEMDLASAMRDQVAAKIKDMVVGLIPEDKWKELVEGQIRQFLRPGRRTDNYAPKNLYEIIDEVLCEFARKKVTEFVDKSSEFNVGWDQGNPVPCDFIEKYLREHHDELLAAALHHVIGGAMQVAVQNMMEQMRRQPGQF